MSDERQATCSEYIGPEGERCAKPAPCQEHQSPCADCPEAAATGVRCHCGAPGRLPDRHGATPDGMCRVWQPGDPPWLAMDYKTMTGAWLSHRGFTGYEKDYKEALRILAKGDGA